MAQRFDAPSAYPDCTHRIVNAWALDDGTPISFWACQTCGRRFEPTHPDYRYLLAIRAAAREYQAAFTSIHRIPIEVDLSEAIDVERDALFDALDEMAAVEKIREQQP